MSKKEIDLLNKQIDKIEDPDFDVDSWKNSTTIILNRIFGKNYQGIKSIEKIQYSSSGIYFGDGGGTHWDNMESCKKQGRDILASCVAELETFGLPEKQESKSGLNFTLNQTQTININLLVSVLEDELTGAQLKEVKEIMKSDDTIVNKKNKLINKIKSFGGDVASNILANILTNPNVWS